MLGRIGDFFGRVVGLVDDVVTSEEERLALKAPLYEIQARMLSEVLEAEKTLLTSQAQIITAEATSESWATRNWRPLTMMVFVTMTVVSWAGLVPPAPEWITEVMKWGLSGYIGGRSLEKITPMVTSSFQNSSK